LEGADYGGQSLITQTGSQDNPCRRTLSTDYIHGRFLAQNPNHDRDGKKSPGTSRLQQVPEKTVELI